MSLAVLVDADGAARAIADGALAIDCRHDLASPASGAAAYAAGHVPGAVHAHLDRDLADLSLAGRGRHPLPAAEAFARTLARWGVAPEVAVIVYDDSGGAYAARLWWMLRSVGHDRVRVLDGGWSAWRAAGLPVEAGAPPRRAANVRALAYDPAAVALAPEVERNIGAAGSLLLDARAPVRFRGEQEPLDSVAGHVPGAMNRPYAENLDASGRFKSPEALRQEFAALLAGRAPQAVTLMCGSGVTACHNLLAMHHAGLPGARVYAGSWSEWVSDPARPVATGAA